MRTENRQSSIVQSSNNNNNNNKSIIKEYPKEKGQQQIHLAAQAQAESA
jgi:hypothetical protein|tara:strand:+ start:1345 stop:1491 length:147 start_codon:yes stop_codon:yes gene_type:complete